MPSLYFVIVVLGMTGGTIGPLPYDKAECESRAVEYRELATQNWKDHDLPNGKHVTRADVEFRCEYHLVRPENDPRLGRAATN